MTFFGGGFNNMNTVGIPFLTNGPDDDGMKQAHDAYQVYVNKEFVGSKILLAANEEVQDIDNFLKQRGFFDFDSTLDGNRYTLQTNDAFQEKKMVENLQVYLQIR